MTRLAAVACAVLALAVSACPRATTVPSRPAPVPPAALEGQAGAGGTAARGETGAAEAAGGVRVLSWNVRSDAFVRDPAAFGALVRAARADILLLDEVAPTTNEQQIRDALAGLEPEGEVAWTFNVGPSGGRQRDVIASRMPQERLPEFSAIVPYPDGERRRIYERMAAAHELKPADSMEGGVPVNGAVVLVGGRRLLVVSIDLQCCGNDPGSWQEDRRRVETRVIRRRIRQVLERTRVDGILLAGDFNLVSTALPIVIASGPYGPPHAGLIAAELYHLGGSETWTWDGRGTPFPSRALDFQLYSPHSLELRRGTILDPEDLPPAELERLGIQPESASRLTHHRPLVAEYVWH